MICPYCSKKNNLTWKRYWKSPFGHHVCSECNKQFKLAYTSEYVFLIMLPTGLLTGVLMLLSKAYLGKEFLYFAVVPALIIGFFVDKYYDGNFRKIIGNEDIS